METHTIVLLSGIALFIIGALAIAFTFWQRFSKSLNLKEQRSSQSIILQEKLDSLELKEQEWEEEKKELMAEKEKLIIAKTTAETQVAEKDKAIQDWEKHKQELITASKTAALQSLDELSKTLLISHKSETEAARNLGNELFTKLLSNHKSETEAARKLGNELSEKLLNNHKSETEATRKLGEKNIQDVSKNLQDYFDKLKKEVDGFQGRLGKQENMVTALNRVLTIPPEMGSKAEVILENNLKAQKLKEGQDYLLQHSFQSIAGKLRPDAVVFLPDDYVLIIDSKSSTFFSKLVQAEDENNKAPLYNELKASMKNHLRNLADKDYRATVSKGIKSTQRTFEPEKAITLMWVPSDNMLAHIQKADPNFIYTASEKNIIIVGPSALNSAITISAVKITKQIQDENQSEIVKETEIFLERVNKALKYIQDIGKNIQSANTAFDKLVGSVNVRLLPSARKLKDLNVPTPPGGLVEPLKSIREMPIIEAIEEQDEALLTPDDSQTNKS